MPWRVMLLFLVAGLGASANLDAQVATEELQSIRPRWVGARMPAFTVKDDRAEAITFAPDELTAPTIFIFYRGGWSSECRRYLRRLRDTEWTLREMGFEVVFLSADGPPALRADPQLAALDYNLLSDSQMQAAHAMGVAYRLSNSTTERYKHYGVDVEAVSGERHHELAFPSAFIVDRTGMIRFVYLSPKLGIRIEAEELLAAAKSLTAGPTAQADIARTAETLAEPEK
jgi:peroxiredoxin